MSTVSIELSGRDLGAAAAVKGVDDATLKNVLTLKQLDLAIKQVENSTLRLKMAQEASTRATTAQVAAETRAATAMQSNHVRRMSLRHGENLALSQTMRQMIAQGGTGGAASGMIAQGEQVLFQRFLLAQKLRAERNATRSAAFDLANARAGANMRGIVGSAMETLHGQWLTDRAPGLIGATALGFVAGGGSFAGEDAMMTRARRAVQRNLARMPELAAKITEEEFETMSRQMADRMQRRSRRIEGALRVGGAVLSAAATTAGQMITANADAQRTRGARLIEQEDAMRVLYGVGDNPSRRAELRGDVLGTSAGTGLAAAQIANVKGRLAAAFGDLDPAVARSLEDSSIRAVRLGVDDPTQMAIGMGALFQMFGKELGGGTQATKTIANRFFKAADVGSFDPDTITPYLASTGAAFQASGYDFNQFMSSMVVASKTGMRPEVFTTALRNVPLIMAKKGVSSSGNFAEDMQAVAGMENQEMIDTFGRDTFAIVKIMADNVDRLEEFNKQIAAVGEAVDVIGEKISGQIGDVTARMTQTLKQLEQLKLNAPGERADNSVVNQSLADAGVEMAAPGFAPDVGKGMYVGLTAGLYDFMKWLPTPGGGPQRGVGLFKEQRLALFKAIDTARKAGDEAQASALELRYGVDTGKFTVDASGKKIYTEAPEADEYAKLVAKGYDDLTSGEFIEWMQGGRKPEYLLERGTKKFDAAKSAFKTWNKVREEAVLDPNLTDEEKASLAAAQRDLEKSLGGLSEFATQNKNGSFMNVASPFVTALMQYGFNPEQLGAIEAATAERNIEKKRQAQLDVDRANTEAERSAYALGIEKETQSYDMALGILGGMESDPLLGPEARSRRSSLQKMRGKFMRDNALSADERSQLATASEKAIADLPGALTKFTEMMTKFVAAWEKENSGKGRNPPAPLKDSQTPSTTAN